MRPSRPTPTFAARRLPLKLAIAALGFGLIGPALAGPWQQLDAAQQLLAGEEPHTKGLVLELPHVSEDGSAVPLTVSFDGQLAEGDRIERIDLFATANPYPEIATFLLTPLSGKPEVSTRVRLNETQQVIAIATSQAGERFATAREVRVTVSGCLLRSGDDAPEPLANPRVSVGSGQPAEVRTLISHPMETGLREAENGETLPRHIIERFTVSLDGDIAFEAELHQAVSANPYLRFYLTPESDAEALFEWHDDSGNSARHSADLGAS